MFKKSIANLVRSRDLYIVLFLGLVCAITIPISGTGISNNAATYLHQGAEIQAGRPMTMYKDVLARGPGFPALLAIAFEVFGRSVPVAMYLVRIFNALGIILVYYLGKMMYGSLTGLIAALLTLTSYGVFWTAGFIDTGPVHVVALLLFFMLLYSGINSRSVTVIVCAGMVLGMCFLIKETTLFYMAGLLFCGVFLVFTKRKAYGVLLLLCLVIAIMVVIPWFVYVWIREGSGWLAFGALSPQQMTKIGFREGHSGYVEWVAQLASQIPFIMIEVYRKYFVAATPLGPCLIIAWLVLVMHARKLIVADIMLSAAILVWIPVLLASIATADTMRQALVIYYLMNMALATVLTSVCQYVKRRFGVIPARVTLAVIIAGCVSVQTTFGGTWQLWRDGVKWVHPLSVCFPGQMSIEWRYTNEDRELCDWISENIPKEERIIVDGIFFEPLDFFSGFKRDYVKFPRGVDHHSLLRQQESNHECPVLMFTARKFRHEFARYRLVYFYDEEVLLNKFQENHAKYAVTKGRFRFFSLYLDQAPWASLVHTTQLSRVYTIDLDTVGHVEVQEPIVNESFAEDLAWLKNEYPLEHNEVVKALEVLNVHQVNAEKESVKIPYGWYH